ncbi:armadillo-type protein [Limtongia smithiae]|uniref:armadillo-type protein n=1 Tax=Limtongia smithiae TaxID=1125753 RepID=UPI0034CD10FD
MGLAGRPPLAAVEARNAGIPFSASASPDPMRYRPPDGFAANDGELVNSGCGERFAPGKRLEGSQARLRQKLQLGRPTCATTRKLDAMVSEELYRLAEQKVLQLYRPADPALIQSTQQELQVLQKSPEAWELANLMLSSPEPNVRFFGALTYTVKLNNDCNLASVSEFGQLVSQLLSWFLLHRGGPQFITQKLASSLLLAIVRFPAFASQSWPFPVYDVFFSLLKNSVVVGTRVPESANNFVVDVAQLTPADLEIALLFCTTFAEEIVRADGARQDRPKLLQLLEDNTRYAMVMIKLFVDCDEPHTVLAVAGLKCYRAWSTALAALSNGVTETLNFITSSFGMVLRYLKMESDEEMYVAGVEVFIDYMEWSDKLVTSTFRDVMFTILTSPEQERLIKVLISDPSTLEDTVPEARFNLFMTFGELQAEAAATNIADHRTQRLLELQLMILQAPGYPIEDENITKRSIEFWNLFTEGVLYQDESADANTEQGQQREESKQAIYKKLMMQVIELYWHKLRLPPNNGLASWHRDTRDAFLGYRKEIADLIESSYPCVQPMLYEMLVNQIIQLISMSDVDWSGVEASLYCLNAITQSLPSDPSEFHMLEKLVRSPLLQLLPESPIVRAQQAGLTLMTSSTAFFSQDGRQYIPQVMQYLFKCLTSPTLAIHASKSIYQICSTCAGDLGDNMPDFLSIYADMLANGEAIDSLAKERIAGAIAEVIQQAVTNLDLQIDYLTALVGALQMYAQRAITITQSGDVEHGREMAASVLKALAMTGKGCRLAIDVDENDDSSGIVATRRRELSAAWNMPGSRGAVLKGSVLEIVRILALNIAEFRGALEIRQNACSVLRVGFTERLPGAFTWVPDVIVKYVREEVESVGNLATMQPLFGLATAFVTAYTTTEGESRGSDNSFACIAELLDVLYKRAVIPNELAGAGQDPDVFQGMLEVLRVVFQRCTYVLLTYTHFHELVEQFAVNMLGAREPLVVKASVKFWIAFAGAEAVAVSEADRQLELDRVIERTGYTVMRQVTWAISGNAPRSLIGEYAQLLKTYFRGMPGKAQKWVEQALQEVAIAAVGQPDEKKVRNRQMFVQKIARLRGRAPTETVVKEFWLTERGQQFNYT